MRAIFYRGDLAAIAASERVFLSPRIASLRPEEPLRRFVTVLCLYSRDIDTGALRGPFEQSEAELYARSFLVADEEFSEFAHEEDRLLEQRFGLPVEQVRARRADLAGRASFEAEGGSDVGGRPGRFGAFRG
jgi:hypothetical protein